jgi:23S rRNA pseudouridine2605 synthase
MRANKKTRKPAKGSKTTDFNKSGLSKGRNPKAALGRRKSRSEETARQIEKRFGKTGLSSERKLTEEKNMTSEKSAKHLPDYAVRNDTSSESRHKSDKPKLQKPDFGKHIKPSIAKSKSSQQKTGDGLIRLNRYIAQAGVCSRREADTMIQAGAVKVNGLTVTELGTKINPTDKVQIGDQTLASEKLRYVLLNKPKGYITTTDDPEKRNTVMILVERACRERIYPVGRLDRNTTGLLLFTNDGLLAKKLTHPSGNIKKIYHVTTDQPVSHNHLEAISEGLNLDDGIIKPDAVDFVGDGADRKQIGIELHSGKNRIVRRIFDALGYKVSRLDRVYFAGLTKKDLPRGHWRFLTNEEINYLKMQ